MPVDKFVIFTSEILNSVTSPMIKIYYGGFREWAFNLLPKDRAMAGRGKQNLIS